MANSIQTNTTEYFDTLYIASPNDQLYVSESDAQCMLVAYDDPVSAIKHHLSQPKCTLFAVKHCDQFHANKLVTPTKYIYTGNNIKLEVIQKITLSPINYLLDWYQMNRLVNYTI
jgi:hypothetical protein